MEFVIAITLCVCVLNSIIGDLRGLLASQAGQVLQHHTHSREVTRGYSEVAIVGNSTLQQYTVHCTCTLHVYVGGTQNL